MTAIVVLARSTARRHWRGIVVIAVLAGLAGAVVLGAAAGARRTATSLDRFNRYSRSADVEVTAGDATRAQLRDFGRSPLIAAVAELWQLTIVVGDNQQHTMPRTEQSIFGEASTYGACRT